MPFDSYNIINLLPSSTGITGDDLHSNFVCSDRKSTGIVHRAPDGAGSGRRKFIRIVRIRVVVDLIAIPDPIAVAVGVGGIGSVKIDLIGIRQTVAVGIGHRFN